MTFSIAQVLVIVMSSWDWIREYAGANAGEGVQAMQKSTGNAPPDSWCCSAVCKAIRHLCKYMKRKVPVELSGACEVMRQAYLAKGKLVTKTSDAQVGWQGFTVSDVIDKKTGKTIKHAHHTYLVYEKLLDGVVTVEGNAADPKGEQSSNGNGLYVGRVRGNKNSVTYNGLLFKADTREYHYGNLPDLIENAQPL